MLDCLIIGGGPAGLTAALYMARFRRQILLVDNGQSRASWIPVSHNFPGFPQGVTGTGLLARLREQLAPYEVAQENGVIDHLAFEDERFVARIGERVILARTVILATGISDAGLDHARLASGIRSGAVRLCPVCDGYEVMDKAVAVIARTDNAVAHALFLRSYTPSLTLIHAGPDTLTTQDLQDLADAGIALIEGRAVEVHADEGDRPCVVVDGVRHPYDTVYPMFGSRPHGTLAQGLGARCGPTGQLITDDYQQTSVPGLYAAGDVVSGLNQIAVAAGHAAIAASRIHHDLPRNW